MAALIALGASNSEIATALNVEQSTVKAHLNTDAMSARRIA